MPHSYNLINKSLKKTMSFPGGGRMDDGELIEIVEMSLLETKKYMEEDNINSPPGFLAGLFWFFINKNPKV